MGAQHQRLRALFLGGEIMKMLKEKKICIGGVLKSVYIYKKIQKSRTDISVK